MARAFRGSVRDVWTFAGDYDESARWAVPFEIPLEGDAFLIIFDVRMVLVDSIVASCLLCSHWKN